MMNKAVPTLGACALLGVVCNLHPSAMAHEKLHDQFIQSHWTLAVMYLHWLCQVLALTHSQPSSSCTLWATGGWNNVLSQSEPRLAESGVAIWNMKTINRLVSNLELPTPDTATGFEASPDFEHRWWVRRRGCATALDSSNIWIERACGRLSASSSLRS